MSEPQFRCCLKCQDWKPFEDYPKRTGRSAHLRERACRSCRAARVTARRRDGKVDRIAERRRRAERLGRTYRTLPECGTPWWKLVGKGYGQAVNLKAHGWRARDKYDTRMVERLRRDHPHLYDRSLGQSALEWRAQYHCDPTFRAKEIVRAHRRKSESLGHDLVEDGTLDAAAICVLFSVRECPYCGDYMRSEDKTLDHIKPRSLGGTHSIDNVLVCCQSCNSRKRSSTPAAWLARLPLERRAAVLSLHPGVWHSHHTQGAIERQADCFHGGALASA